MADENRKYDQKARFLYELHRRAGDPPFYQLKGAGRDYWRALAQVSDDEDTWPEPEGGFGPIPPEYRKLSLTKRK